MAWRHLAQSNYNNVINENLFHYRRITSHEFEINGLILLMYRLASNCNDIVVINHCNNIIIIDKLLLRKITLNALLM